MNVGSLHIIYVSLILSTNLVTSELNPACECATFQGAPDRLTGEFTSPNYPNSYRKDILCLLYVFIAPPSENRIVEIDFREFNVGGLSKFGRCDNKDYLKLYINKMEPAVYIDDVFDVQLCGNRSMLSQTKFYSRSKVLIMELSTDDISGLSPSGFRGVYRFLDVAQFQSDASLAAGSKCTHHIMTQLNKKGQFFSPGYPQNYDSNLNCAWIFHGDMNERVEITFLHIDLATQGLINGSQITKDSLIFEYNHPNRTCDLQEKNNDLIMVYDGASTSKAPVIGRFCGKHRHVELASTGRRLLVKFKTNEYISMQGFSALFRFFTPKPEWLESCNINITSGDVQQANRGFITSPNFPSAYPSGAYCTYNFQSKEDERISIQFNAFDLGTGGLDESCGLNDALTSTIKVNGSYLAPLKTFCGSQIPPSIMSNGPFMRLEFESQRSEHNSKGFNFTYRFVKNFGIKADVYLRYFSCGNMYESSNALEGEITSPNYPGLYPHNTECTYVFRGQGKKVRIQFIEFDVIGKPAECLDSDYSDYVSFSNYYTASDKKMTRYCVHNNKESVNVYEPVVSDQDYFRMVFTSNSVTDGYGFRAKYTFFDPPPASTDVSRLTGNNRSSSLKPPSLLYIITSTYLLTHIVTSMLILPPARYFIFYTTI